MNTTYLSLSNQGHSATASNTVAATSLSISIGNSSYPGSGGIATQLFVLCVAIYATGVSVSSITPSTNTNTGWTFRGSKIDTVTGIRVECWTNQIITGVSFGTTTINFSGSTLASACVNGYVEPYDFPSVSLVDFYATTHAGNVHTDVIYYPYPITAGNLIVIGITGVNIFVAYSNAPTDNLGTSYSRGGFAANTWCTADTYVGLAGSSSSSAAFTVVWPSSGGAAGAYFISQYSGMTATIDGTLGATLGSGTFSSNITTTNANDLIYTCLAPYQGYNNAYWYQNPLFIYQGPTGANGIDAIGSLTGAGTLAVQGYCANNGALAGVAIVPNTFSPAAAPNPQTASTSGVGYYATGAITSQSSGNIIVTCVAFASSNGDSFAGTSLRTSVVPTVTSAAAAIIDSSPSPGGATDTIFTSNNQVRFNASRNWVSFSFELNSGNTTKALDYNEQIRTGSFTAPLVTDYYQKGTGSVNFSYTDYNPNKGDTVVQPYKVPPFEQTAGGASMYITAVQLGSGVTSVPYSETIHANGGFPPYTYSILTGSLPSGLSLNSSTGVISGTPTTVGTSSFTILAVDSASNSASNSFSITVTSPAATGGSAVFISS